MQAKAIDNQTDERDDLEKLQGEYIGLSLDEAHEKAGENGLEINVVFDGGKWIHERREAGKKRDNAFGVFVHEDKIVAIYHEETWYTGADKSGVSVWEKSMR